MFDTRAYLNTYYTQLDSENKDLIQFWHNVPVRGHTLEIGCGPTIFTAIPIALKTGELLLTDAHQENLDEIAAWQTENPDAFNWDLFINYYVNNFKPGNNGYRKQAKQRLIDKLKNDTFLDTIDLRKPETLRDSPIFETIVSAFCLEVAARSEEEFEYIMSCICRMMRPHAVFGLIIITNSDAYTIEGEKHELTNISDKTVYRAFSENMIDIEYSKFIPISEDRAYKNILSIYGRRMV